MELSQELDTHHRQQAIDGFLDSLSSWDLIYLRRRMHIHESRIRLSSFEDLPAEIIIYIAQFLELDDLLTCPQVCRSWREAWTFGAVTGSLCRRYFPGLTEKHGLPHSAGQHLFSSASRRYIDKYLRPNPNAWILSWWLIGSSDLVGEENMFEDGSHPLESVDFGPDRFQMCYQDGMLVWQPDDAYVIINDLKRLTRRRCGLGASLVAGRKLDLQEATKELIVFSSVDLNASSQVCRELQIRNLALGEWRRLSLPGRFAKCYANDDSVIALTSTGEAFYWSWGSPTVDLQVRTTPLTEPPRGCVPCLQKVPGAVFHPTEKGIFFLSWVYTTAPADDRIHVVVVVKYQQGNPVRRYETTVANPSHTMYPSDPYANGTLRFSLRCQKMNSHGLYMLGVVHTCLLYERNKGTEAFSDWKLVCFNVLTETLTQRSYGTCMSSPKFHYPTWNWADWHDIQAWDDYLVVLWQPRPHVIHEPCTVTQLLMATDTIACISGSSKAFREAVRLHRLEPALTIDTFHKRRSAVAHRVFMDDDFIIYAAPDSLLVSKFKKGKDFLMPPLTDSSPLQRVSSRDVTTRTTPPQPLQTWDGEVYTTLEVPRRNV